MVLKPQDRAKPSFRKDVGAYVNDRQIDDVYIMAFWCIMFVFLRAFTTQYLLEPLATYCGIKKRAKKQRFVEQSWQFVFFLISWTVGMYIMYHSPYWFSPLHFWIGYPHQYLSPLTKWYYLIVTGYWLSQMYVVHIEKRRKDHVLMVSHHCVTIALLIGSYFANLTRIGNAVLCMMDFSDIILTLAKSLYYLEFKRSCDIAFGIFVASWFYSRHFIYFHIIYSLWKDPGQLRIVRWDPESGSFFGPLVHWIFLALLGSLQVLLLIWCKSILRILWTVIKGSKPQDTRSESEDD
ncbi:longevity assurance proteins LAG1/LAC1 [Basidiobolus meristosporus CBS 931.73]|uniref:Longevity assurance proteins LAG1/LAC1 n=1 Tax=Basidiobolus meristosporus CBS 931.73 TaxID=1314790 RepID=A0A1Y1YU70_9FUNG|nr:longevity assurance proteins LAG1/LAC1 [Basidiobolus meristosporus CBS 931.73]|eukprot:ORY01551.1 longevity assurance proteins LAG1/LAC1 [Basidiobolus meristosporus CBS 931.73]